MLDAENDTRRASTPHSSALRTLLLSPVTIAQARWAGMDKIARAALLVSVGSLMLVVMATAVKHVGLHLPSIEILFFRAAIGFCPLPETRVPWR